MPQKKAKDLIRDFANGGSASSSGVRRLKMSGYQAGGDVSPAMMTPEQLDEFNRNLQRELDEENRRFEKSGGPEFYSAIRPAMEDINERVKQTLELYRMGRATEADVQKLLPSLSEYEIASQFGRTDTGGYRSRDVDAPSRDRLREFIEIQKPTIDANRPDMFPYEKYDPRGPRAQGRVLEMSKGGDVTDEMFVGTRPEDFPETSVVDKKAGELLRALSEGTRGFVGAEPIEPGSEAYRTGQALANMPAVGVVAATAKGAGKAKDALKALTKKDIKLIASELETSRGQLAELAKKYPQLRDASVADIEALTKGEPFTAFRGISLLPGRELRKESTPSMTVDPSVALGMLKDAPVMITKEGFITATPVLRQYPGMKASETQVYVPSLIEQITERQPGALEMKIPTRSGEKMTVADVFKEVKGEKELLADVSKKEPRDILFDRYQGGVGDRYLMEVARRVLAGKWEGGEALLKEIGGYQTDPKGLVQEFDSFAELVKESALKKAKGGDVSNDEFIQEMITGTRPTDLPVKRQEEGVSNNNSTQEMFLGTRPEDFPETSPVDTAVSDFISSRSKLVTDPQEFFRVMGQNIEEYHGKPLREDPQKYLTEQLGPGALAGTVGKTAKQLFSSLPSSEAPFVSRLDEFVSSLPGAVQKDQFLNQLKGKFRDYDIGRAQEALADLPGNAKLTPFDLLNRVKRVYDPTTFTTKIDLPKAEGDYYAGMDNPFKTKEGFSQKPLGVIHLLQGVNPATSPDAGKLMAAYDDIVNRLPDTSFNIFDKTDRNPVSLAQDIYKIANRAGLSSVKDLGMDVQTVLQNMAQSGSDWNTLVSSKHRLGHPGSYKPEEIKEALSETARITGTLPEENVKSLQKIAEEINARRTAKEDYSDLESQYHKSFPYAFAEDLEKANRRLWNEHREGKRQIGSLLEGLQKREGINTRAYKGQHSSLAEDPSTIRDPIAFSRFTEHTTDIPGLGKVDGIYVNELQSDRLDDIRKKGRIGGGPQEDLSKLDRLDKQIGEAARQFADYKTAMGFRFMNETDKAKISDFNSKLEGLNTKRNTLLDRIREGEYSLKESFAGMEESPQVIQQLMAKNAVAGAMQLGKRFVAFPGAESAQAQLYEKLPNNLKQVVKDLGPGFELRPITLPKPDTSAGGEGGELTSYAIVWGDEAADRIKKQGVPFKDGGEVSTKDFIKRLSKGGDVSNDEFIQEMMTGTRPTDETTSPGILPPEIRQAVDVPLDFANLLIRGTAAVPIGGVAGLYKGLTGGKYGTQEGVKEADTEAARMMAKITGEPKTQAAKDVLEFIGGKAQEYKLDAALPQLLTLPSPGPGAASALMRSYEFAETPPLGTVKLAGDKGVKPATPPTDQMGFYSPAEKAVMGLPQDKGTASQMLAQITKTQGVKPVELRATGLEDYLKGKGNAPVTKQEIQDFLTNNRVQVDEVVLGKGQTLSPEAKKLSGEALSRMEEVDNKLASYFEGVEEVAGQDPYSAFIMLRSSIGRRAAKGDQEALDELNAFNLPPEIKDLVLEFGRNKNEYIKYTSQARKMEKPKFDKYNTPGGQNAREIYLTLPGGQMPSSLPPSVNAQGVLVKPMYATQPKFTAPSPHSVSPEADANRLAHIFLDERKDAKGDKVLFVQELQSDWAQQGRDKGFAKTFTPDQLKAEEVLPKPPGPPVWTVTYPDGNQSTFAANTADEAIASAIQREGSIGALPPAPFVSTQQYQVMKDGKPLVTKNKKDQDVPHIYSSPEDAQRAAERFGGTVKDIGMQENTEGWVNLALKRVIKEAVDNDIDTVAFIKGGQAADKYSLRTFVDYISADRKTTSGVEHLPGATDDLYVFIAPKDSLSPHAFYVGPDGIIKEPISADVRSKFLGQPLSKVIGKETAEKLLSTKIGESQVLRDEGLTLGGKGMEGFYDNILPKTAEKLLKKLGGGKVEPVEVVKGAPSQMPFEANAFVDWMEQNHPGTSRSDAARAWGMGVDNNRFVKEFYEATKSDQYLGFKITPEMKEMVKTEGLPKFAAGGEVTDFIKRAA
jgi:hypothetical protein